MWSRCRERDETVGFREIRVVSVSEEGRDCRFRGIRVVSVLEEGRDCRFRGNLCGLGAGKGTRLQVFGDFVWSRCRERDETAGFGGIREVSVSEEGRDCQFPVLPCGLGVEGGTRLPVSGDSVWSRCLERDETAGSRGIRAVKGAGMERWWCGGCTKNGNSGPGPRSFRMNEPDAVVRD